MRAVTAARRAGVRASAAGERQVHGAGAHAGPRLQQAGRWHALPCASRCKQVRNHLVGPVLAALRTWDPVLGLVVGF